MASTILVVDDEPDIASAIATRLESVGYDVEIAHDGLEAVQAAAELRPDLVVLDLLLPGLDGLEVCRRIQTERPVPVVMLTARDDESDMIIGLGVGADDYMTKPFSPRELVARIGAVLRRTEERGSRTGPDHQLGPIEIWRSSRRIIVGDHHVNLTPTEFDLLAHLAAASGSVLSREELLMAVWGRRDESANRALDSHVRSIRRKLGDEVIHTIDGLGYALGDIT